MPKVKPTVDEWIRDHTELKYENNKLICRACIKVINCEKKYNIIQHVKTAVHQDNLNKMKTGKNKQQTLLESMAGSSTEIEQKQFYFDLCKMMVSCNIPLTKLNHSMFNSFLQKYTGRHIPAESTLRKNYVDLVYNNVIEEIKKKIGNNYIWFCVDETTDSCGRYIAHLMIGILNEDCQTRAFLIGSKQLEQTNNNTITRFIHDELTNFFLPNPVPSEKILLMLSDAAAYMIKAYTNLKVFYEHLVHCTCLAHGLNRVAETIRAQFPLVNTLIKTGKKVFVKAPLRIQFYRERLPGVPLPPEPVITRWGTWLEAAYFYADNFDAFKEIILELPQSASQAIENCQAIVQNEEVKQNLAFIKTNYRFVSEAITKLEDKNLALVDAVEIIEKFRNETSIVRGAAGAIIFNKLTEVLNKNTGYKFLNQIANVIQGNVVEDLTINATLIPKLKYAPITSVDVEGSFSHLKYVLSDRRTRFSVENLEKQLVIGLFTEDDE